MRSGSSSDEIARMLADRIADVVADLYPGATVRGPVAYCSAKGGKDLGSFHVYLRQHGKYEQGSWHRWSEGIGGGPLNLIAYALTGSHKGDHAYREAFQWARRFLGLDDRAESDAERQARERRARDAEAARQKAQADEVAKRAAKEETASALWRASERGGRALRYLEARMGGGTWPEKWLADIRTHASCWHDLERRCYPALVALVRAVDASPLAVWRIYLNEDASGKAPVEYAKLGLGPAGGGAVRVGGLASAIGVAEGVETALACAALDRWSRPVWATLSTSGMIGWQCPTEIEDVTIYADHDDWRQERGRLINPGLNAAEKLRGRLVSEGKRCRVIAPPPGMDFLDLWLKTKDLVDA